MKMVKDEPPKDERLVKYNESPADNTVRLAKKGFFGGILFSILPLHTQVQTNSFLVLTGKCLGNYAIPFGVSAGVFGAITSLLDEYRGKDKLITNAAMGGFVAGVVYGSRTFKPWKAFQAGCRLAAAAAVIRYLVVGERIRTRTEGERLIFDTVYHSEMEHLKPGA
ncbi:hypothetical protein HELRODRAFT_188000 [Helobdella robusta]|uniref:Mitochondrial import inner membrane translocase subunit TIM22 n=1 Tax=Helobdella robusta TaxID=6412 RepID=T1FPJ2_HELRO|nr:hypothetical protein HELRODRAFT_188000 [Helobdella robusta]ESO12831.1 hypothetical protein HELRODRAFT_188000 [Helobdella robusta]